LASLSSPSPCAPLRRLGPLGRSTLWVLLFCIVSVTTGYLLAPSLLPHLRQPPRGGGHPVPTPHAPTAGCHHPPPSLCRPRWPVHRVSAAIPHAVALSRPTVNASARRPFVVPWLWSCRPVAVRYRRHPLFQMLDCPVSLCLYVHTTTHAHVASQLCFLACVRLSAVDACVSKQSSPALTCIQTLTSSHLFRNYIRVSAATWCFSTSPATPLSYSPVRLPRHCPSPHPSLLLFLFFLCWVHPSHATPPRFIIVRLARHTQRRWLMRSCRQACVSGGLVRWPPLGGATRSARHRYLSPSTNLFRGSSTTLLRQRLRRRLSGSSGVGGAESPGCGSAAGSSFPVGRLSCFFVSVRTRVR